MSALTRYGAWFVSVAAALQFIDSARDSDRVLGEFAIGIAVFVISALLMLFSKGAKIKSMWAYAFIFGGLWAAKTIRDHIAAARFEAGLSFGLSEILYFLISHLVVVCLVFSVFWIARLVNDRT
jgi:hypothetical protein